MPIAFTDLPDYLLVIEKYSINGTLQANFYKQELWLVNPESEEKNCIHYLAECIGIRDSLLRKQCIVNTPTTILKKLVVKTSLEEEIRILIQDVLDFRG